MSSPIPKNIGIRIPDPERNRKCVNCGSSISLDSKQKNVISLDTKVLRSRYSYIEALCTIFKLNLKLSNPNSEQIDALVCSTCTKLLDQLFQVVEQLCELTETFGTDTGAGTVAVENDNGDSAKDPVIRLFQMLARRVSILKEDKTGPPTPDIGAEAFERSCVVRLQRCDRDPGAHSESQDVNEIEAEVHEDYLPEISDFDEPDPESEIEEPKESAADETFSSPSSSPSPLAKRTRTPRHLISARYYTCGKLSSGPDAGPKRVLCSWCPPTGPESKRPIFDSPASLLEHIKIHANEPGVPTCNQGPGCSGRVFLSEIKLKEHDTLQHMIIVPKLKEKKMYICENCGVSRTDKRGLAAHIENVHINPPAPKPPVNLNCTQPGCKFKGANKKTLGVHIIRHLDPAQRKQFQCPRESCSKTFLSRQGLSEHLVIHDNPRHFICNAFGPDCGHRRFNTKKHLIEHIIIVHGNRKLDRSIALEIANRPQSYTNEPSNLKPGETIRTWTQLNKRVYKSIRKSKRKRSRTNKDKKTRTQQSIAEEFKSFFE